MRYAYLTLAAAVSYASAAETEIPVGQNCTPGGTPCASGADCYAVNSMLQPICGNFQSSCKTDAQCAFNTCNDGFCNGLPLSASSVSSSAPAASSSPACAAPGTNDSQGRYSCNPAHQYPAGQQCILVDGCYVLQSTATSSASGAPTSTPTAPAGTVALGEKCDPSKPSQCAGGASCYATNSMLQPLCGNFQASCTTDAQCAFNTCNGGFCNGLKASSSANATSGMPTATGGYSTGSPTHSSTPPFYTGAASVMGASGAMAAVFAAVAYVL